MSDSSENNAVPGFVAGAMVMATEALIFFVAPGAGGGDKGPANVDVTIGGAEGAG
jgi:hypothetical protein